MFSNAALPYGIWVEAMATTIYLMNRFLNEVLKKVNMGEIVWIGKPYLYKHIKTLVVRWYNHIPKE